MGRRRHGGVGGPAATEPPWHAVLQEHVRRATPHDVASTRRQGWVLLCCVCVVCSLMAGLIVRAAVTAEVGPPTGGRLGTLRHEWQSVLLPPLCIPVTIVAAYLSWVGQKFFIHN
eukprot:TRINITY_DN21464_c0_g1_i1.p1 TRINITY_DN21464_c0_g1~~TRINITY_DN21464_c0_g1_i1.p1  ORF type:complete len:115 (+),score=15.62 TRINITY_DN21464_c0_g1_i1:60-404(+)